MSRRAPKEGARGLRNTRGYPAVTCAAAQHQGRLF